MASLKEKIKDWLFTGFIGTMLVMLLGKNSLIPVLPISVTLSLASAWDWIIAVLGILVFGLILNTARDWYHGGGEKVI